MVFLVLVVVAEDFAEETIVAATPPVNGLLRVADIEKGPLVARIHDHLRHQGVEHFPLGATGVLEFVEQPVIVTAVEPVGDGTLEIARVSGEDFGHVIESQRARAAHRFLVDLLVTPQKPVDGGRRGQSAAQFGADEGALQFVAMPGNLTASQKTTLVAEAERFGVLFFDQLPVVAKISQETGQMRSEARIGSATNGTFHHVLEVSMEIVAQFIFLRAQHFLEKSGRDFGQRRCGKKPVFFGFGPNGVLVAPCHVLGWSGNLGMKFGDIFLQIAQRGGTRTVAVALPEQLQQIAECFLVFAALAEKPLQRDPEVLLLGCIVEKFELARQA